MKTQYDHDRKITIDLIELHISKVKSALTVTQRGSYINKTSGILSLAKLLEIITIEEYEHYFEELFK